MTTRSLTDAFLLMRNNAVQSRHFYSEQNLDDRVALVSRDRDPELGMDGGRDSKIPPKWVDGVEEFHYEVTRVKQKLKELANLHDKHLNRPTLDESSEEERAIDHMTQEITQIFQHCQRLVHQISAKSQGSSPQEQRISQNVITSLVTSLRELYFTFRSSQSSYVKRLKSREERSQQYFETNLTSSMRDTGLGDGPDLSTIEMNSRGFSKEQLLFLEDNTWMVEQREREVTQVVRSIAELNEIFKDLGQIVVDQGTVLDRIDFNIEHSQVKVKEGLQQLQKAETYQKKNRKMYCILGLSAVTTILIIILIFRLFS